MDPIHALMTEHRIIEHALDSFTAFATRVASSDNDGRAELARYVAFFREFADRLHHQKEEEILFAEMVNNGFPGEVGPVACMLHEHVEGRMWVARLDGLARAEQAWGSEARRSLAMSAAQYAALLRTHIKKEDHALYPMAENHLTSVTLEGIGQRIAAVDASPDAAAARAALIDLGTMMDENARGSVADIPFIPRDAAWRSVRASLSLALALSLFAPACDDDDDDTTATTGETDGDDANDESRMPTDEVSDAIRVIEKSSSTIPGGVHVHIVEADPNPPTVGENLLTFMVMSNDTKEMASEAEFSVEALMPAHNHGSSQPIVVTTLGMGRYSAKITFQMPGDWQVKARAKSGTAEGELTLRVSVD